MDNTEELNVSYTPAVIEFDGVAFKQEINEIVKAYNDFDFNNASIKDVRAMRAPLNKLVKRFEEKRKEVKEQVLEPYKRFEGEYKDSIESLSNLLSQFKSAIDEYDTQQKELRNSSVRNYFNIKADEAMLDREVFDKYIKDFQKESDFKRDSFELTKKTMNKLDEIIVFEIQKENAFEAETRYRTTVEFEMTVEQIKAFKEFLVNQRIKFKTVEDAKEIK